MGKFFNNKWKKFCSWVLCEEEIKQEIEQTTIDDIPLDYDKFTKEKINNIAEKFKEWMSNSENDFWNEWLQNSIAQVIPDLNLKTKII